MKIEELSNHQIVTIVVAILGGDSEHVHPEDIAIKADELATGKFNWRKHPNRIDLNAVYVALRDSKKVKNGQLIIGGNQRGWMLSSNGLRWLEAVYKKVEFEDLNLGEVVSRIIESLIVERERLISTNVYHLFINGRKEEITKHDFFEFTRTNEYFKTKATERRYTIVENAVMNDSDLEATWNYLFDKFMREK